MRSFFSTRSLTLLLSVTACGVASYIVYLLLKKEDDDDYTNSVPKISKHKSLEIRVPKESVRLIIGRKGNKIKQIQEQTGTTVNFKDEDFGSDERVCVIQGSPEGCAMAEHLINEVLTNQPVLESLETWIPQQAVGKLIGRCGENIIEINNKTGAHINIDDSDRSSSARRVVIKGTKEQINYAMSYIEEVVDKYQNQKMKLDVSLSKREPRMPSKHSDSAKTPVESPRVEKITTGPGQTDSPFEVYVSAMIDPSRFWVQIVGPKATELDLLVEEMTEYYRKQNNRDAHCLQEVQRGDLVAATFQYDNKWYRAEVLNLVENDISEPQAELYYVDYGDTDTVFCKDLFELRTDFLRLHFQAIECFLAKVDPLGVSWSEEAIDKFEEWTHVAQWQKLSAKINGYCVREKTRAKREGSPVPGVDLFDVNNEQDMNIADELVRRGYAVAKRDSQRTSRATSVSNVSVDSA